MPVNWLGLLAGACCIAAVTGNAQAQAPDLSIAVMAQEWQASEVERVHLAEALQKLIQAYTGMQDKQKAVDAYWKDYVAGLTGEAPVAGR